MTRAASQSGELCGECLPVVVQRWGANAARPDASVGKCDRCQKKRDLSNYASRKFFRHHHAIAERMRRDPWSRYHQLDLHVGHRLLIVMTRGPSPRGGRFYAFTEGLWGEPEIRTWARTEVEALARLRQKLEPTTGWRGLRPNAA